MAAFIILGMLGLIFLVLGIVFYRGKGAILIAGFNTLPKEEQDKYDVPALCRLMGNLMFVTCFCVLLIGLSAVLETQWVTFLAIAILLVATLGGVIYANTGNRFRKN
ncbi:DUF3784 domain-containing protein [Paenibacillus sp. NFR01]|uniref:DUF3784 domain-containing protein n=1 Tax=Paenibacillus sp. NFR01 TaxID=1566279 RepID=UPI0008D7F35E|nr:DUF3784 domain-containing protein [Paenibacillus sp. NFR01]SEU13113.1 protein of unknown function [Paenibacillus sp. NFR01]